MNLRLASSLSAIIIAVAPAGKAAGVTVALPDDERSALSVLDFVVSTVDSIPSSPSAVAVPPPKRLPAAGTDALDFISESCAGADYYDSGSWSRDEYILYPAAVTPPVSGVPFPAENVRISSPFGYRALSDRMHYGIDIAMPTGDSIKSPLPGTVAKVAFDAKGYGHYIIVVHDCGIETRYAHLSRPLVEKGDRVDTGSLIALSGNTGNSTGPHLHLEARYRGVPVDPRAVFVFF